MGSVGSGLRTEGLRTLQKASYVLSLDSHCLGAQADSTRPTLPAHSFGVGHSTSQIAASASSVVVYRRLHQRCRNMRQRECAVESLYVSQAGEVQGVALMSVLLLDESERRETSTLEIRKRQSSTLRVPCTTSPQQRGTRLLLPRSFNLATSPTPRWEQRPASPSALTCRGGACTELCFVWRPCCIPWRGSTNRKSIPTQAWT